MGVRKSPRVTKAEVSKWRGASIVCRRSKMRCSSTHHFPLYARNWILILSFPNSPICVLLVFPRVTGFNRSWGDTTVAPASYALREMQATLISTSYDFEAACCVYANFMEVAAPVAMLPTSSSTSMLSLSIFPVKARWLRNTHSVDRNMPPFKLLPSLKVDFVILWI